MTEEDFSFDDFMAKRREKFHKEWMAQAEKAEAEVEVEAEAKFRRGLQECLIKNVLDNYPDIKLVSLDPGPPVEVTLQNKRGEIKLTLTTEEWDTGYLFDMLQDI